MELYSEEAIKTVLAQAEAVIKRFPFGVLTVPIEPADIERAENNAGSCTACSGAKHPAAHQPADDDHYHHGNEDASPLAESATTAEMKDTEKGEPQTASLT